MSFIIYHLTGDNPCGKPALMWLPDALPVLFSLVRAKDFSHLDGTECVAGNRILCDSCGRTVHPNRKNFKKVTK